MVGICIIAYCSIFNLKYYCVFRNKRWLINIKRADLDKTSVDYRNKNIYVCAEHFTPDCFMNKNRNKLIWNAIPTIFNFGQTQSKTHKERKLPKRRDVSLDAAAGGQVVTVNSKLTMHSEHSYALKLPAVPPIVTEPEPVEPEPVNVDIVSDTLISVSLSNQNLK